MTLNKIVGDGVSHSTANYFDQKMREVVPADVKNNVNMCILINATYKRNDTISTRNLT